MKFFDKTSVCTSLQKKYDYIKNHFSYYTMNSWNGLQSIANNVKLYRLGLTEDEYEKAFNIVFANDGYNEFIDEVNIVLENSGLEIGFNGRSNGYLVLYNPSNNCSVLNGDYENKTLDNYIKSEMCPSCGYNYRETRADLKYIIETDFELVKAFDRVCDEIRDLLLYYIKEVKVETVKEERTIFVTKQVFNFV